MKNSIDAHVEFSFKGETYAPSATINLDDLVESHGSLQATHAILAEKHGIDTYSYLYEVMQQAEIFFDNAQGLAADFLVNGEFDEKAFAATWQENQVLGRLQTIATREMAIDDLHQHQGLTNALFQAYQLGKSEREA
ncbi:MAG: hypothetical protein KKH74_10445 [Gammaproteobacteria bacterium]|nr:hypothetical protein [Gammaproteobacteria bacterium]MBU1731350.1 hypothetical protein [Gammaproteobacteria bacterium]MBU1892855.1 hypothetical protein [Gammaproteobacteria bacterium]